MQDVQIWRWKEKSKIMGKKVEWINVIEVTGQVQGMETMAIAGFS